METKLEGGHKKGDGKFLKGKNSFMKIDEKSCFCLYCIFFMNYKKNAV